MAPRTSLCRHQTLAAALLGAVVALLVLAGAASALFSAKATGGPAQIATATMLPPSLTSVTQVSCRTNKTPNIEVSWSASGSSYTSGYSVERATASAGPYTVIASLSSGESSYLDSSASLGYSTTYYYRVSASLHSWSAASTAVSVKTLSKSCQAG